MRQERVVFASPGTFVAESSEKPIPNRDIRLAVEMSRSVKERHGATPYGFYFRTVLTAPPVPDGEGGTLEVVPKEVDRSGMHFLGGVISSLDDLRALNDPKLSILIGNMECNGWAYVVTNTNSYRSTQPFEPGDVVVDGDGRITERGDTPERMKYRAEKAAEREERLRRV